MCKLPRPLYSFVFQIIKKDERRQSLIYAGWMVAGSEKLRGSCEEEPGNVDNMKSMIITVVNVSKP